MKFTVLGLSSIFFATFNGLSKSFKMKTRILLLIYFILLLSSCKKENEAILIQGNFTDIRDDRIYETIKIDKQWWMAENLAYLPSVSPSSQGSATVPYYYVYDYQGTDVGLSWKIILPIMDIIMTEARVEKETKLPKHWRQQLTGILQLLQVRLVTIYLQIIPASFRLFRVVTVTTNGVVSTTLGTPGTGGPQRNTLPRTPCTGA